MSVRLDRLISNLGYCSRKDVSELIRQGRLLIDGEPPKGLSVHVTHEQVLLDDKPLDPAQGFTLMLNKPRGYTCSHKDGGTLVYELFPIRFSQRKPILSSVGRLDKDSSGLLLFTDDGELLHRITSPHHEIWKVYEASLARPLQGNEQSIFASGSLMLEDEDTPLKPARMEVLSPLRARISISEGRYHQVRRMFAAIGNHVEELHRTQIGSLSLESLALGQYRILSKEDISLIFS